MARGKRGRRRRRRRRVPGWRWWLVGVGVAAALAAGAFVWKLNTDVSAFLAQRTSGGLSLYAAPFALRTGVDVDGARLRRRLHRLGYREIKGDDGAPPAAGAFRVGPDHLDIGLRGYHDGAGEHPPMGVRLDLAGQTVRRVLRLADATRLDEAHLEPALIRSYGGGLTGERRPVRLDELPPHVIAAVLAAEDVRFAAHPGLDPVGIARAALVNLREGAIEQGGSTITQQLAKNIFLSAERRWSRKATEAILAIILELRLTKADILETYLNTVYVGRIGSLGLHGIGQATRVYYGVDPRDLSIGAAAMIAGMLRGPNTYSPLRNPARARARRDQVLAGMAEQGWIDGEQLAVARVEPVAAPAAGGLPAAFFVDQVLRQLRSLGYEGFAARGLAVHTTLDLEMQDAAEAALARGLDALDAQRPRLARDGAPLEGAVVLIEAGTGFVRALTGGRDFARSQFNRATRARRQPGSAFKPFVYLAALDDPERPLTAASVVRDEPLRQRAGGRLWTPANYDGRFLGAVTVRRALVDSRNVPAVRVALDTGIPRVAALAEAVGLGPVEPVPAVALGAAEVTLLALVGAYTVFPNLGEAAVPILVRTVVAPDGTVLHRAIPERRPIASAAATYVAHHLLEGVVDEGTGRGVRERGLTRPAAGKTGTTNDARDAWFVGYSPELVAGVWVGFDDGTPVGLTGASAALPVWVALMKTVLPTTEAQSFRIPHGVVFRSVDRGGGAALWPCRHPIREAFVAGTEPAADCDAPRFARQDPAPPPRPRAAAGAARPAPDARPLEGVRGFFRRIFRLGE